MVAITQEPIKADVVVSSVADPGSGAVVVFQGVVRDCSRGRRVVGLEYEAYRPMAEATMREIAAEIRAKWGVARVAIVHRVGSLCVGETSVVIAVSAAHRKEAFEACQYAIDRVKTTVPIWKKELYEDGQAWVPE